jgi:integrase
MVKKPASLWRVREFSTPVGPGLSEYVFQRGGRPTLTSAFEHQWRAALNAAGLPGKLFHGLRRIGTRDTVRGGASESFPMKLTGVKTRSMFDRYRHRLDLGMREALRRRRENVARKADPPPLASISDRRNG